MAVSLLLGGVYGAGRLAVGGFLVSCSASKLDIIQLGNLTVKPSPRLPFTASPRQSQPAS